MGDVQLPQKLVDAEKGELGVTAKQLRPARDQLVAAGERRMVMVKSQSTRHSRKPSTDASNPTSTVGKLAHDSSKKSIPNTLTLQRWNFTKMKIRSASPLSVSLPLSTSLAFRGSKSVTTARQRGRRRNFTKSCIACTVSCSAIFSNPMLHIVNSAWLQLDKKKRTWEDVTAVGEMPPHAAASSVVAPPIPVLEGREK